MRIFISYSRQDCEMARRLFTDLKGHSLTCWFDQEDLQPGQFWRLEIEQAIRDSSFFLVLISRNSISKKGFVQKEVKLALDLLAELPINEVFIVPVRLEDCIPSYPTLRELQWVDLFPSYDEGLARLVRFFLQRDKSKAEQSLPISEYTALTTSPAEGEIRKYTKELPPIHLVRCKDSDGRKCYFYLTCSFERADELRMAFKQGTVNLTEYGEIVASGFGRNPSAEVKAVVLEKYNVEFPDKDDDDDDEGDGK